MNRVMRTLTFLSVGAIAVAANAQKAYIDYDRNADLSKYKTFVVVQPEPNTGLAEVAPLTHQHVMSELRARLAAGGKLVEVQSDPDLNVTYRVTAKEEATVTTMGTAGPGWGGRYAWAEDGWGTSTTTVDTYLVGTLIIDVWDARSKQALWRGVASATVPDNPQKGIKKIDDALDKLSKKWHDMQAKAK